MKKASELVKGMRASVKGWAEGADIGRFLDLGILPGSQIEVLRSAPFHGASYLKTDNGNFALRLEELDKILVSA
jgi:ferrous iron transport protein A